MRNRRFVILAAILVTLNAALLLAPQGLALRQVIVSTLFGKNMVRAQVLEMNGTTYHVDRGVVLTATGTLLTVKEADTAVQPIVVSSATKVTGTTKPVPVSGLKPGWHVLVTWVQGSPAASVLVERK